MKISIRLWTVSVAMLAMTGCASVSSLPQSAKEANFDSGIEGKTG
jgi:uncharacterized protein YceK